jgi:hypothetical protein
MRKQTLIITVTISENEELSHDLIDILDKHNMAPWLMDKFSDVILANAVEQAISNGTARIEYKE